MDFITIFGFALGIGLLFYGANQGGGLGVFLNAHGLAIVVGGTFAMTLVNSSTQGLWSTMRACVRLFFPVSQPSPEDVIKELGRCAESARTEGIMSLQNVNRALAGNYLGRSTSIAMTSGDPEFTRSVLEEEIMQMRIRHQTVIGILRTTGVVSPMVGLLGTLIGIVSVLQQITDPTKVGPAMATALSTAFYGILIAAFFAVPVAGKLKERSNNEILIKQLVVEGLVGILKKEPPYLLDLRLRSFARQKGLPTMSAPLEAK
jgi:chemotaxis protein MotA